MFYQLGFTNVMLHVLIVFVIECEILFNGFHYFNDLLVAL